MKKYVALWIVLLWLLAGLAPAETAAPPGTWTAVASMNVARENHTLTLLPDGRVLAVGGFIFGGSTHASAEIYNPATNSWAMTGSMSTVRQAHTATLLQDGRVLVVGGLNDTGGSERSSAEIYDPATGTWSMTSSMLQARNDHHALRLLDGRVVVIGGRVNFNPLTSVEIFNPGTGSWSPAASLASAKGNFASTLLADGRVMVAGGFVGGSEVNTYQIYNPDTNSWTAEASMNNLRSFPTVTLLSNGQVLAAGGSDGFPATNRKTELFNPATNTWTHTAGDLAIVREFHSAHLLPNGQVLVAGGNSGSATITAELYSPGSGTWSSTGSFVGNRHNNEAVTLADGRVLASGGFAIGPFNSLATAEIYEPTVLNQRCGIGTGVHTFHLNGRVLTVDITTLGDINCLTVRQMEITHPNATSNMARGVYWQINATNVSSNPASGYTLNLQLPNPFGTAVGVAACRYPGGLGGSGWDCTNTQSATSSQVTATGVTQLSDWVIGRNVGPTAVQLQEVATENSFNWLWLVLPLLGLATAGVGWWRKQ